MYSAIPGLSPEGFELKEKGLGLYPISFSGREGQCHQSHFDKRSKISVFFSSIAWHCGRWTEGKQGDHAVNMRRSGIGKRREQRGRKILGKVREILRSNS